MEQRNVTSLYENQSPPTLNVTLICLRPLRLNIYLDFSEQKFLNRFLRKNKCLKHSTFDCKTP